MTAMSFERGNLHVSMRLWSANRWVIGFRGKNGVRIPAGKRIYEAYDEAMHKYLQWVRHVVYTEED